MVAASKSKADRAAAPLGDDRRDLTAALPTVRQPTLLIWGDADPISPVAVGRRPSDLLPNARLEIVPGGDHGFVEDRPGEIAGWVEAHLS